MFRASDSMEKNEIEARKAAKVIVDLIADGKYGDALSAADESEWDKSLLEEVLEGYKEDNDITEIFSYDTPVSDMIPDGQKEYFYHYNDGSGFGYEYALDPTDLTMMLDFIVENDMYKVIFIGLTQL